MKKIVLFLVLGFLAASGFASNRVTIDVRNRTLAEIFSELMTQTGKDFVYASDLPLDERVSLRATDAPLKNVLRELFRDTDIEYRMKGKRVILKSKERKGRPTAVYHRPSKMDADSVGMNILDEVIVVTQSEPPLTNPSTPGAATITGEIIRSTPALLGEPDVLKAFTTLPGVTEATEGMAGMSVHGGGPDENLYLFENVPLYHVNHFGGLFSAFNPDVVKQADFYRTAIPVRYDGRLSSVLDVSTIEGDDGGHHGTARFGLTSGAFNISGPIKRGQTYYTFGIRRSWFDVITIPMMSILNSMSNDETNRFSYSFTDINGKISHHFSPRTEANLSFYFGSDMISTSSKTKVLADYAFNYDDRTKLHWGNIMGKAGLSHRFTDNLKGDFGLSFLRYFSDMKTDNATTESLQGVVVKAYRNSYNVANSINDWTAKGDFIWNPEDNMKVRFGGAYTLHSFSPSHSTRELWYNEEINVTRDSVYSIRGGETNFYVEDEWTPTKGLIFNAGLHFSTFAAEGRLRSALSPRFSAVYNLSSNWSINASYTRTAQYFHHLATSYLSLPTDRWIAIGPEDKPLTADKVGVGGVWKSSDNRYSFSVDGYFKAQHNLLDYKEQYYLVPAYESRNAELITGSGQSYGIDLMFVRNFGKLTGRVGYSLSKSVRRFDEINGGQRFPARFDVPHSVNIVMEWEINPRVMLNATWVGRSGFRYTLMTQSWSDGGIFGVDNEVPLMTKINNYRLPFYHRLDLSLTVRNSRGYWNFGLYNAYCHLNTIGIRRSWRSIITSGPGFVDMTSRPVFQKVCLLPLIPSISYTWEF